MTLTLLIVMALAAYRLTRIVTKDAITEPVRAYLTRRIHSEQLDHFVTCDWCAGFYVSAAVVSITDYLVGLSLPVFQWLAVSCVVGLIGRIDD